MFLSSPFARQLYIYYTGKIFLSFKNIYVVWERVVHANFVAQKSEQGQTVPLGYKSLL